MSEPHSPVPAYVVGVLGIALFSIMDMVMKGLTLAIGTYPTLLWRSLIGIALAAIPYFATRNPWPRGTALKLHLLRGAMMVPMAIFFFCQAQADLGRSALIGSFAILGSAIIYAFNIIVMRRQAQNAGPIEIAF